MQPVTEIVTKVTEGIKDRGTELFSNSLYDSAEWHQKKCDSFNNTIGNLTGYDCPICKNKGDILVSETHNGRLYDMVHKCECMTARRNLARIERSGIKELLTECTFDNFQTADDWQKKAKAKAESFTGDYVGKWFFAGGQVGSGKTHLCTGIVGVFLNSGKPSKYMLWRDEVVSLKSVVTDDSAYSKAMKELKETEVLYIDDFFKCERGKAPTAADINIAFELLNYRYINRQLITVISSELSIDGILDIDEAVGSRIYQRAKDYCLIIGNDKSKNYRLR